MDYSVTKFLKVNLKFSKNEKKYLNLEIYKEQRNSTVCGLFLTKVNPSKLETCYANS